jgi:hypothetical protein
MDTPLILILISIDFAHFCDQSPVAELPFLQYCVNEYLQRLFVAAKALRLRHLAPKHRQKMSMFVCTKKYAFGCPKGHFFEAASAKKRSPLLGPNENFVLVSAKFRLRRLVSGF